MRTLLALTVVSAVAFCGGFALTPPAPTVVIKEVLPSLVLPDVFRVSTGHSLGTGMVVDCEQDGTVYRITVLTCAHVVGMDGEISLLVDDRFSLLNGMLAGIHPTEDAALLVFFSPVPLPVVTIRFEDPEPGTELFSHGFPLGDGPHARIGLAGLPGQSSCNTFPGDSGGPLSLRSGEVVGMSSQCAVAAIFGVPRIVSFMSKYVRMSELESWFVEVVYGG